MQQLHNYIFQRALLSIFTKIAFLIWKGDCLQGAKGGRGWGSESRRATSFPNAQRQFKNVHLFIYYKLAPIPINSCEFSVCIYKKQRRRRRSKNILSFAQLLHYFHFLPNLQGPGGGGGKGRGSFYTTNFECGWRVVVIWWNKRRNNSLYKIKVQKMSVVRELYTILLHN